ncbi:MAG: glycosyltransferase [Bacteroidetes bacterium]|nr:glycosyltransferase [Bacteroidota bacterium]
MKILHLNTLDDYGAARGALFIHNNLKAKGHHSKLLVASKTKDNPDTIPINYSAWQRFRSRLLQSYFYRIRASFLQHSQYFYLDYNYAGLSAEQILARVDFKPDIIMLHWIANFITPRVISDLQQLTGAPVVWYLQDAFPITGGCNYTFGCERYADQCGKCPIIGSDQIHDWSFKNWKNRHRYYKDLDLTMVCGSSWSLNHALKSSNARDKLHKEIILHALDINVFEPVEKTKARQIFDLPIEKKILFFGAQSLNEERKGIRYLMEALSLMKKKLADLEQIDKEIIVAVAGRGEISSTEIPYPVLHLGFIDDDRKLSAAYSAADVFVNPSTEDYGPMAINESVLSGTPVVCFDIGVASDLIHNGQTGYRVTLRDSEGLANGLISILSLSDNKYDAMSQECRQIGLERCNPSTQADQFTTLFESLLS